MMSEQTTTQLIDFLQTKRERLASKKADLRAQLDRVDAEDRELEITLRTLTSLAGEVAKDQLKGPYSGMTIVDAVVAALRKESPAQGIDTRSLIAKLEEGGFVSKAKDPYTSIFGTLSRASKQDDSDVVALGGGIWALREWGLGDSGSQAEIVSDAEVGHDKAPESERPS